MDVEVFLRARYGPAMHTSRLHGRGGPCYFFAALMTALSCFFASR